MYQHLSEIIAGQRIEEMRLRAENRRRARIARKRAGTIDSGPNAIGQPSLTLVKGDSYAPSG